MNSEPEIFSTSSGFFSIIYRGKDLYSSSLDVRSGMKKRIAGLPKVEKLLLFIPSPLFFYDFDLLLSSIGPDTHILCIETDQALMSLSVQHTPREVYSHHAVTYIRTESSEAAGNIVEELGVWKFRKVYMLTLNRGYSLYPDIYRAMFEVIQHRIENFWNNKMTLIKMGRFWNKNLLKNLALSSNTESLSNLRVDKPVIVAGAGESLELSIDLIKRVRDRVFLICADTAVPVLTLSGITPDLIIVLETQLVNLKDFIGLANRKIPVAFDLTSHPGINSLFKGRKFIFLSKYADIHIVDRVVKKFPGINLVPPLGSVGITAVYIAKFISSSSPVFLTGIDFSYSADKTHARGALFSTLKLVENDRVHSPGSFQQTISRSFIRVRTTGGIQCLTNRVFLSYARQLQGLLKEETRFFVIGDKGLPVGVPVLSISETENFLIPPETPSNSVSDLNIRQSKNTKNITNFLSSEKEQLRKIINKGQQYLSGREPADLNDLLKEITQCNYLYLSFPDLPPLPKREISFLQRVLLAAGYYLRLLEKIV